MNTFLLTLHELYHQEINMKYIIILLSLSFLIACGTDNSVKDKVSQKIDLVDHIVGTYQGSIKLNSTPSVRACEAQIVKISAEQIEIDASSCRGESFKLILDKSKSAQNSMIFRNRNGQVIARIMGKTLSYQFPLNNGDVENFNGTLQED